MTDWVNGVVAISCRGERNSINKSYQHGSIGAHGRAEAQARALRRSSPTRCLKFFDRSRSRLAWVSAASFALPGSDDV